MAERESPLEEGGGEEPVRSIDVLLRRWTRDETQRVGFCREIVHRWQTMNYKARLGAVRSILPIFFSLSLFLSKAIVAIDTDRLSRMKTIQQETRMSRD